MKNTFCFLFIFLYSMSGFSQDSIIDLLPDPFALPGLQLSGDPEIYKSADLPDLIGSNAEIYLEYGFVKMISQYYSGIVGTSNLKIEIYQMTDPEAAFGIFAFSSTRQKIIDKTSYYVVLGKGYDMMVKGPYFIIATYSNLTQDLDGSIIKRIADDLKTKIKTYAELPKLYVATQPPCRNFTQSLYFRGPVALSSMTYLDFKLPFDFTDGVFYRCDVYDYLLFLPDSDKSKKEIVQETISNILKKNPGFVPNSETFGFSIKENDHLKYEVLPNNNSIVLIKYF